MKFIEFFLFILVANLTFATELSPKKTSVKRKILATVDEGYLEADSIPEEISFDTWVKKNPEWNVPQKSFVFHRDRGVSLIQRLQLDNDLCHLHAPIVAQHYLVGMNQAGFRPTARISFRGPSNGYTDQVLKAIIKPGSVVASTDFGRCEEWLVNFGPGIITQFAVEQNFLKCQQAIGKHTSKTLGYHAMLVIGSRRTTDGELRLLLQNWWYENQFIEIDETYWENSMTHVVFVKTPQTAIPSDIPTTNAPYAVTTVDRTAMLPETFD